MAASLDDLLSRIQLDVAGLANMLRAVRDDPIRRGRKVTGTVKAGQLSTTLTHGLGRAYQGAHVMYGEGLASALTAQVPGLAANQTITVTLGGVQANDVTFALWVF